MKIGLVLEGGAMRGMFTAGVLDTFLDNDIKMDSVGSCTDRPQGDGGDHP